MPQARPSPTALPSHSAPSLLPTCSYLPARSFPCPHYTNPTDHFLSVLRDDGAADAVVEAYQSSAAARALGGPAGADVEAGLGGKGKGDAVGEGEGESPFQCAALENGGHDEEGGKGGALARAASDAAAALEAERPRVPFAYQAGVLSLRMLRNWGRNPMMLAAEAVQVGRWLGGRLERLVGGRVGGLGLGASRVRGCARRTAAGQPADHFPLLQPPTQYAAQYLFLALFVGLVYLQ